MKAPQGNRILFVCFADSTHAQSWMSLLRESEFEVRVFASPAGNSDLYPPQPWEFTTYSLVRPRNRTDRNQVHSWLPRAASLKSATSWMEQRFYLTARYLRRTILSWKPEIVHSLRLFPEAWLTCQVLQQIPRPSRPRWVVSSWGSDINIEGDSPQRRPQMESILRDCDGFIADCKRDVLKALSAGLDKAKVAEPNAIPVTGGLNLEEFARTTERDQARNLVVVPKAYEGFYNKTLPILEALSLIGDPLDAFEVHLVMCSEEVQMWVGRMTQRLQSRVRVHASVPRSELLSKLGRARVLVAPSLSDGTPITMLEAMAAGALPLMSPLDSIQEWITDGHNGLLAPALYPEGIAAALRRALTDDELQSRAQKANRKIVSKRADREKLRPQILDYYRSLRNRER